MKLTPEEAAARLAAAPEADLLILRIGEGDYGCEERSGPPTLWVLVQDRTGAQFSLDLPEPLVDRLGLTEGGLCRKEELSGGRSFP